MFKVLNRKTGTNIHLGKKDFEKHNINKKKISDYIHLDNYLFYNNSNNTYEYIFSNEIIDRFNRYDLVKILKILNDFDNVYITDKTKYNIIDFLYRKYKVNNEYIFPNKVYEIFKNKLTRDNVKINVKVKINVNGKLKTIVEYNKYINAMTIVSNCYYSRFNNKNNKNVKLKYLDVELVECLAYKPWHISAIVKIKNEDFLLKITPFKFNWVSLQKYLETGNDYPSFNISLVKNFVNVELLKSKRIKKKYYYIVETYELYLKVISKIKEFDKPRYITELFNDCENVINDNSNIIEVNDNLTVYTGVAKKVQSSLNINSLIIKIDEGKFFVIVPDKDKMINNLQYPFVDDYNMTTGDKAFEEISMYSVKKKVKDKHHLEKINDKLDEINKKKVTGILYSIICNYKFSLRELDYSDIQYLENVKQIVVNFISKKHNINPKELICYIVYPSETLMYFNIKVEYLHGYNKKKIYLHYSQKIHLLETVIYNLKVDSNYYKRVPLYYYYEKQKFNTFYKDVIVTMFENKTICRYLNGVLPNYQLIEYIKYLKKELFNDDDIIIGDDCIKVKSNISRRINKLFISKIIDSIDKIKTKYNINEIVKSEPQISLFKEMQTLGYTYLSYFSNYFSNNGYDISLFKDLINFTKEYLVPVYIVKQIDKQIKDKYFTRKTQIRRRTPQQYIIKNFVAEIRDKIQKNPLSELVGKDFIIRRFNNSVDNSFIHILGYFKSNPCKIKYVKIYYIYPRFNGINYILDNLVIKDIYYDGKYNTYYNGYLDKFNYYYEMYDYNSKIHKQIDNDYVISKIETNENTFTKINNLFTNDGKHSQLMNYMVGNLNGLYDFIVFLYQNNLEDKFIYVTKDKSFLLLPNPRWIGDNFMILKDIVKKKKYNKMKQFHYTAWWIHPIWRDICFKDRGDGKIVHSLWLCKKYNNKTKTYEINETVKSYIINKAKKQLDDKYNVFKDLDKNLNEKFFTNEKSNGYDINIYKPLDYLHMTLFLEKKHQVMLINLNKEASLFLKRIYNVNIVTDIIKDIHHSTIKYGTSLHIHFRYKYSDYIINSANESFKQIFKTYLFEDVIYNLNYVNYYKNKKNIFYDKLTSYNYNINTL